MSANKREQVGQEIRDFVQQKGRPSTAYYFDDCYLAFAYYDDAREREELDSASFAYWEEDVIVGKYYLEEQWTGLLNELDLSIPIFPAEYYFDDEEDEY